MCHATSEIECPKGRTLHEAYLLLLKRGGRARECAAFLLGLSAKTPLLSDVSRQVRDQFLACEARTPPPEDGAPLVFCAVTDAIAVSVPSEAVWDRDRISVPFHELLPDGTLGHAEEEIDNLARSAHAGPIGDRHREGLRLRCSDSADLWSRRAQVFPHLIFGPDVQGHLTELNPGWLSTLVSRLADLEAAAAEWAVAGGDAPRWRTKVTPESGRLMSNPKLREARRFRSVAGAQILFEWHARFGGGGRIHLRFDARTREIEVGYVGGHLPLR